MDRLSWAHMNTTLQPTVPVFNGCQRSIPQRPSLTLAAEALRDDSPPSSAGSAKSAILVYETDEEAYILEEEVIRLQSEFTILSCAHHFPLATHRSGGRQKHGIRRRPFHRVGTTRKRQPDENILLDRTQIAAIFATCPCQF